MLCFTGVSGAILNAAGQSVVDECKKHSKAHITIHFDLTFYTHPCDIWKHGFNVMFLNIWFFIGPLVAGSVLLTGAGNLNCDHIAHISGSNMITCSILNVLQLCEKQTSCHRVHSCPWHRSNNVFYILHLSQYHNNIHISTLQYEQLYCTECIIIYFLYRKRWHYP